THGRSVDRPTVGSFCPLPRVRSKRAVDPAPQAQSQHFEREHSEAPLFPLLPLPQKPFSRPTRQLELRGQANVVSLI
ncbi:hypothetical protein HMPREF1556_01368, partial [Porphyromonas sp. oral taxon 278 str. W7784]